MMIRGSAQFGIWLGVLWAVLLGPVAALAQEYPLYEGPLGSGTSSALPGDTINVSGGGFEPGGRVTITLESDPIVLAVVDADSDGGFSADIVLPVDTPAGSHRIRATGPTPDGGMLVLTSNLEVAAGTPVEEPESGMSAGMIASIGAVAAAAAAGLVIVGRRILT